MAQTFLTAQWRKLIMANYVVDPSVLKTYLPSRTELDFFNGQCLVSLVGFLFTDVRVMGMAIPLHREFEEVNLRFYVRHKHSDGLWRRGVVFISEIVPRRAIAFVANNFYGENYRTMPMKHSWKENGGEHLVAYSWKHKREHRLQVRTGMLVQPVAEGSEEEFITEHYWGYTKLSAGRTGEYEVVHPRWDVYPVNSYEVEVDFGLLYGNAFANLTSAMPSSIFLAEGSQITVRSGTRISI